LLDVGFGQIQDFFGDRRLSLPKNHSDG
jgi:hypothetical protein